MEKRLDLKVKLTKIQLYFTYLTAELNRNKLNV